MHLKFMNLSQFWVHMEMKICLLATFLLPVTFSLNTGAKYELEKPSTEFCRKDCLHTSQQVKLFWQYITEKWWYKTLMCFQSLAANSGLNLLRSDLMIVIIKKSHSLKRSHFEISHQALTLAFAWFFWHYRMEKLFIRTGKWKLILLQKNQLVSSSFSRSV